MKKLLMVLAAAMMISGVGLAQQAQTYRGEIMDSDCAKMGAHPEPNAPKCTVECIAAGSKYVLFNAAGKTVYQLDDQKKPVQFAGKKVVVSGTLDKATSTIHVTDIKAGA